MCDNDAVQVWNGSIGGGGVTPAPVTVDMLFTYIQ